jgi:hypothetical protein
MNWFRRFMGSEYSGLDNFVPNRDVIRTWISSMLTVQRLKPSTINIRLRTVKAMSRKLSTTPERRKAIRIEIERHRMERDKLLLLIKNKS